jgi:predicted lipid-binding transport protein (Tim44 family)
MAYSTQKRVYLGYLIAGGIVTAGGGSILAMGLVYAWLGGLFQSMMGGMGGMPSFSAIFGTMGFGMAIGGGIALIVGLALLGSGVSKKKQYYASASPPSAVGGTKPGTSTGREYSYTPSPAYGTISAPVATPVPVVRRCRSCGDNLPEGPDAQFCPSCGAPTR